MDKHPVTTQLAQAGVHGQRYGIDFEAPVAVRARGVAHLAYISGQQESGLKRMNIAEPVLGVGNPAVVGKKLFIITFEAETNGVTMGQINGISVFLS